MERLCNHDCAKVFEKKDKQGEKNKEKIGFITATYYNKNVMDGKEMYSEAMHYQHDIIMCFIYTISIVHV